MKKNDPTSKVMSYVEYLGGLRCTSVHLRSGQEIISDAPVDNNGKGEAFSPTDLVATALAKCVITIMGIKARDRNVEITGTKAEVIKVMASGPRRIAEVHIVFTIPNNNLSEEDKTILEKAGRACPVAQSLHPDLEQRLTFNFR